MQGVLVAGVLPPERSQVGRSQRRRHDACFTRLCAHGYEVKNEESASSRVMWAGVWCFVGRCHEQSGRTIRPSRDQRKQNSLEIFRGRRAVRNSLIKGSSPEESLPSGSHFPAILLHRLQLGINPCVERVHETSAAQTTRRIRSVRTVWPCFREKGAVVASQPPICTWVSLPHNRSGEVPAGGIPAYTRYCTKEPSCTRNTHKVPFLRSPDRTVADNI
jgi:hypothetical protein